MAAADQAILIAPRSKDDDYLDNSGRQPPLNPSQPVLYHDPGRYVVVSKPADVRMDGDFKNTVENLILGAIGVDKESGLRFVQRLDYATSGVLIAALTKRSAAHAGSQFEKRSVTKKYIALLHGVPPQNASWSWRVGYVHPDGFKMRSFPADSQEGRTAYTEATVLRTGMYHGARVSLVELAPASGRRHQLRVHTNQAGHPIVGDATYIEREEDLFDGTYEPPRMMLHAASLTMMVPPRGVEVRGKIKSALKQFIGVTFRSRCPFEELDGLQWDDLSEG